eukprot:TRINITY_DN18007_c0_g1_i1.p1 TRINITY_DN18007_c0_g1~~TRINITY_DN18007_c0_g1_i1.p1  ORF type:complete len:264 (-),score=74.27 TRINITY_DN18007_c0_g1_i1:49-777(-)
MTLTVFAGGLLVSLSPALALFTLVVCRDNQLLIFSIGGAFFWLCGILLASLWWYVIPLHDMLWFAVLCSVFFQEAVRALSCFLMEIVDWKMEKHGLQHEVPNRLLVSMAIGLGCAVVYVLVNYASLLSESTGPGALFSPSCPGMSLFMVSSLLAFEFLIMHIAFSVIAFESYRWRKWHYVAYLWVAHYSASFMTMLNDPKASCVGAILGVGVVMLATVAVAIRVVLISPALLRTTASASSRR